MTKEIIINNFINEFCEKFNITLNEIKGKSRVSDINIRRNLLIYMLRRVFKLTSEKVGILVNRNHANVLHHTADFYTSMDLYDYHRELYQTSLEFSLKYLHYISEINNNKDSVKALLIDMLVGSNTELKEKVNNLIEQYD